MPRELEICCYSVSDAVVAAEAGADRIELCDGRPVGGTTPPVRVLRSAAAEVRIPTFPMVRPRGGNFVYDDHEFAVMRSDVTSIAELGFRGLVFGILHPNDTVDYQRCAELVSLARKINPDIELTFHRAFDDVIDPVTAYHQIRSLGFDRLLTSGQQETAVEGAALIAELIADHANDPAVMPGGGVRPENVAELLDVGATNIHSSATLTSDTGVDLTTVTSLAQAVHGR